MRVRIVVVIALALLGCRRVPAQLDTAGGAGSSQPPRAEPTATDPLAIEREPEGGCHVVAYDGEGLDEFDVVEHESWVDLWFDRGLGRSSDPLPSSDAEARASACEQSEDETGVPACDQPGPLALTTMADGENVLIVVQELPTGVRSVELSRWPILCRCDCRAKIVRIRTEPLVVVATEFEHVADDVHFEGDEVVPGCDDPATQDCQTACMGSGYGRQQLVVFDEQLRARDRWTESFEGEDFTVEFGLVEGRVVAQRECMQVLVDR